MSGWVQVGNIVCDALEHTVSTLYEPPYESPIEDILAWHLAKHAAGTTSLKAQVSAPTICGRFRLDFVVSNEVRTVGLECDALNFTTVFTMNVVTR